MMVKSQGSHILRYLLLLKSAIMVFFLSAGDAEALALEELNVRTTSLENAKPSGNFTDIRDGKIYRWVRIGTQVWMAEDLNCSPFGDVSLDEANGIFVGELEYSPDINGRYYTWYALMDGEVRSRGNPSNGQGLCPFGWHIPSNFKWGDLVKHVDANTDKKGKMTYRNTRSWVAVGKHLKSKYGRFVGAVVSTDEFGLHLTPSGLRYAAGASRHGGLTVKTWTTTDAPSDDRAGWSYNAGYSHDQLNIHSPINIVLGQFGTYKIKELSPKTQWA